MTIIIEQNTALRAEEVLYPGEKTVKALARAVIASMLEASIDMICDAGEEEYPTRKTIEDCLSGTPDMGVDFINDTFDELKQRVIKELLNSNVKAQVLSIRFDEHGHYDDVEVKVDVEAKQ